MTKLISKVQYRNFEPGEFVDVQARNLEETIQLIEHFPWDHQREKLVVELTNPSITIEGKNDDFLKLALYFNHKYVLHYFDEAESLYTRSFINLNEGYEYIKKYFDQAIFDIADFKKEPTWLQHNLKHFVSQDFKYKLTPKSIRSYLLSTSGINFCLPIMFGIMFLSKGLKSMNIGSLIMIILTTFLVGGGIHLILFFSYYNYARDKILIMSKGNDLFYFGDIDHPIQYTKKDIVQYTIIKSRGSRNQFNGFAIVEIELKNGTVIKIPNILVDYTALQEKLFEYKGIDVNKFPYLRA